MNTSILYAVFTLGMIGLLAAVILYFIAQKFKVFEDPRIDQIAELLPSANCGGCGFAGCRNFAEQIVQQENFDNLYCPVGGNDLLKQLAPLIGKSAVEKEPEIAVIRCNGTHTNSPAKVKYDGLQACSYAHMLSAGTGGCPYGCLGCGDCVRSCTFEAMFMDETTGLPVVISDKCVACGACVKACPRHIIELRYKGKNNHRIFVSCINEEKGGVAKKNCSAACIGCSKCHKTCKFEAIQMKNHLAYIDHVKCTLCKECVVVCPTGAIHEEI